MKTIIYKEGKNYWVRYGNDPFFGPNEKCFDNKKDAEKFANDYDKEHNRED